MKHKTKPSIIGQIKLSNPERVVWIQCIAFIILYAVWALPEIVGVRNTALVIGAIAGIYCIYQNSYIFFKRNAILLWIIAPIFLWATIHLLFLSQNYEIQLIEFKRIWRYTLICAIFAVGLGISIAKNQNTRFHTLIYTALVTPQLIYLIKLLINYLVDKELIINTCFYIALSSLENCYIPKSDYVAFCLPGFAMSCGYLFSQKITSTINQKLESLLYIFIIFLTLIIFINQSTKNGLIYAAIIVTLAILKNYNPLYFDAKKKSISLILLLIILVGLFSHSSWGTFLADLKLSLELEKYPHWLYSGEIGWPINEIGKVVSTTNYERLAWFYYGIQIAPHNIFGYGLIEDSFEYLVRLKYPFSSDKLSHSHSGWLDLYLGIGFYSIILFVTLIMQIFKTRKLKNNTDILIFWTCTAFILMWLTTELSATVTFNQLIFWVFFCVAYHLKKESKQT